MNTVDGGSHNGLPMGAMPDFLLVDVRGWTPDRLAMVEGVLVAMGAAAVHGNFVNEAPAKLQPPAELNTRHELLPPVYASNSELVEFGRAAGYSEDIAPRAWNILAGAGTRYADAQAVEQATGRLPAPDARSLGDQAATFVRIIEQSKDGTVPEMMELRALHLYLQVLLRRGYNQLKPPPIPGLGPGRLSFIAHYINARLELGPEDQLPAMDIPTPLPTPDMPIPPPEEFEADPDSPYLETIEIKDSRQPLVTPEKLQSYASSLEARGVARLDYRVMLIGLIRHVQPDISGTPAPPPYWAAPGIYFLGAPDGLRRWGVVPERLAEIVYNLESDEAARAGVRDYEGLGRAVMQRYINALQLPTSESDA